MSLHSLVRAARERLERAGIAPTEAAVDSELLARHVLGWDRATILAAYHEPPPHGFAERYEPLVARREAREPAAYITGVREFWNRDFQVRPGVLAPRPETEFIIEETLALVAGDAAAHLADVGTGSGCLAVTLALERPRTTVLATDVSIDALVVALCNIDGHDVRRRVRLVQTDLLDGVHATFDVIVSNPPYVPDASLAGLSPEVRGHEPLDALRGGADGLGVIRRLLSQAATRLRPGGHLIFEFGFGQEEAVGAAVATRPEFTLLRTRNDLQGIPRTAVVRKDLGA